jgi:hypothetical protein
MMAEVFSQIQSPQISYNQQDIFGPEGKGIPNTKSHSATKIPSRWPVAAPYLYPYCSTVHILPTYVVLYCSTIPILRTGAASRVAQSQQSPDQTM